MNNQYKKKVDLLLRLIPIITQEDNLAIHGGTAINLFVANLPRLSIDIDLTYIPIEDRETSIYTINETLKRIASRVVRQFRDIRIVHKPDLCKLICERSGAQIKIEVNKTKRGLIGGNAEYYSLCEKATEMFGVEVEARIVSIPQLYGGKIAAALSRQHPRDIFDIMMMKCSLENLKEGIIFNLLGSDRPIYESLEPNIIDQRETMRNQFFGMTDLKFEYDEFEQTRDSLIINVRNLLNKEEREFLVSFEAGNVNWDSAPYNHLKDYPSVKWKLHNLENLKSHNPAKLKYGADRLHEILFP